MTSGEAPGGLGSRAGAANGRLGPEMPLNRCSKLQNAANHMSQIAPNVISRDLAPLERSLGEARLVRPRAAWGAAR